MKQIRAFVAAVTLLALTACGGGGGGGPPGTSLSVSPTTVSFSAVEGSAAPAATTIRATFVGDGVLVGYPPGATEASWLSVTEGASTTTTADVVLGVTDTLTVGTRTTTLRFVTGRTDGSDIKTVDVPVSYTVTKSDLDVSVNPGSLTFVAPANGALPAQQNVSVTFTGSGATISGVPPWLTVVPPATGASPATFGLKVNNTNFTAGSSLAATLTVGTTRPGSTFTRTAPLQVSYRVFEPFGVMSSATPLAFDLISGDSSGGRPTSGYQLNISGTEAQWRVAADQPWVRLSSASGTGRGNVTVTVDPAWPQLGSFNATITVTDDQSGATQTFPVSLASRAARLVLNPTTVSFVIDTFSPSSALSRTFLVSDELGGSNAGAAVTWEVQSTSKPWVQVTPTSGSSVPATTATVALVPAELERLASGQHTATVTLRYSNAQVTNGTIVLEVALDYSLATVSFVAPYLAIENVAGPLIVRGAGFSASGAALTVAVGTTELPAVLPDSNTQLRVNVPALAAGRYRVFVKNDLGIVATNADLVVVPPLALAYQAIDAPSQRRRIVYDAERQVLYGVNRADHQIERYSYSGGVWSSSVYVLANVTDLDLYPNGRSLVVLTKAAVNEIPLDSGPFAAQQRATNPDTFCDRFLDKVAMANNGKALIIASLGNCSGYTGSHLYDVQTRVLDPNPYFVGWFYNGIVAAGADGSKLYAGSNGLSPEPEVKIFDAFTSTLSDAQAIRYNLSAASVSGNASRVILQNRDVYSGSLTLLGYLLPSGTVGATLASRSSARAYVYRDDGSDPRIEIYDLNGPLQPGALYPLANTVDLPDSPNVVAGNYLMISLAESPDGRTLFVSGDRRILVVPVN